MAIFLIADSEVIKDNLELNLPEILKIISDNNIKKFRSAVIAGKFPEEFLDFMRKHLIIYKDRESIDSIFIKDVFLMYYLEVKRSNKDRFVYLTNDDRFIEVNRVLKKESETDKKPLTLELYFWKDKVSDRLINSVDRFIPLESIEDSNPLEFTDEEELPEINLSGISDYDDFPEVDNNSTGSNVIQGI